MEKKPEKGKESQKKSSKTKGTIRVAKKDESTTQLERRRDNYLLPYDYINPWQDIDRTFKRFSRDLEVPTWSMRHFSRTPFSRMLLGEGTVAHVDLEDRVKDFLLTAELPGFKKEDVDVQITRDGVEVKAATDWKQDERARNYVRKERGSRSVYRMIRLPEEVKTDVAEASLKDGILEVVLPKKAPKAKRKLAVK